MRANPLEVCNQLNVFVRNQMLEPASIPIGLGTQSKIGPMDVAMILDELVQREVLGTNSLSISTPAVHLNRSAHRVGSKLNLAR
jgi:hypothetical protein